MRNRNCSATFEAGDGHDRMRLGANGRPFVRDSADRAGDSARATLQRRRSTSGPRAPRKVRRTLSARCCGGIMAARTQMAVLDKEI